MNKQTKVTAITKENLTKSFWNLYKLKRIEKITIKEITNVAGYNRSTFYEYFIDVYDILDYLEESNLRYMEEHILNDLDFLNNEEVIKRITNLYEEKGEFLSHLLGENGNPSFRKKFKNILKLAISNVFSINEKDIYSDYIFEYVMSATIETIIFWFQENEKISLNELIALIRSIHTRGALHVLQKGI